LIAHLERHLHLDSRGHVRGLEHSIVSTDPLRDDTAKGQMAHRPPTAVVAAAYLVEPQRPELYEHGPTRTRISRTPGHHLLFSTTAVSGSTSSPLSLRSSNTGSIVPSPSAVRRASLPFIPHSRAAAMESEASECARLPHSGMLQMWTFCAHTWHRHHQPSRSPRRCSAWRLALGLRYTLNTSASDEEDDPYLGAYIRR